MATRTGPTRLATGVPAVSSRSTGFGSGESILRTAGFSGGVHRRRRPPATAPSSSGSGSAGGTAGSSASGWVGLDRVLELAPRRPRPARSAGSSTSTVFSRSATNWSSSLALTSASTPRPNWATRPVTVRSVAMATAVPSPSGVRVAVMVALALPWPRVSRPSARSTATCVLRVERQELGLALVLRGDRADLHLHDAAVLVALDLLELRARAGTGRSAPRR